jgi:alkanesulfonate monooxygenase SsuD/methylene tetrahydromethanopterin reductase-like flavin-dependent oxidoreductase (luciferase family)
VDRGRARGPGRGPLDVTLGVPAFIGDDVEALRDATRHNLALYTFFPFFQHLFRASGFTAEADAMERGEGTAALTTELLDSMCLIGPLEHCQQRLAEYRSAGVDMPILMAPRGVEEARNVIDGFRRQVDTRSVRRAAAGAESV